MNAPQIKADIESYLEGTSTMIAALDKVKEELNITNQALTDIDHFLELNELNDDQLLNLVKSRSSVLLERRRYKDAQTVIESILPKQVEGRTTKDRYDNAINKLGVRIYTPRVLDIEDVIGGPL